MFPSRIVCLTEETTETLYLLGEADRVVGISGYTVRPPEAREKPRISSFLHARYEKIEALNPDLVLAFSDLQAEITTELIKRGYPVFTFNQRSVAEILQMIRILGGIVGSPEKGNALAEELQRGLERIQQEAARLQRRPRVYFEEWDDPLIAGIRWVEELIEIAGGEPSFPQLSGGRLARDRVVASEQVIDAAPEIVVASWCGKPVRKERICSRPGWSGIPAVRIGDVYEIKSAYILQPGPASLTDGVAQLHAIIREWASRTSSAAM
jgi:iron complex transport system substrate-binding protein